MRELYRADLERLGRDLTEIARLVHRAMMDAQAALEAADVHGACLLYTSPSPRD